MRLLFIIALLFVLFFQPEVYALFPGPQTSCCIQLRNNGVMEESCDNYNLTLETCQPILDEWEKTEAAWLQQIYMQNILNNPIFLLMISAMIILIGIIIFWFIKRHK